MLRAFCRCLRLSPFPALPTEDETPARQDSSPAPLLTPLLPPFRKDFQPCLLFSSSGRAPALPVPSPSLLLAPALPVGVTRANGSPPPSARPFLALFPVPAPQKQAHKALSHCLTLSWTHRMTRKTREEGLPGEGEGQGLLSSARRELSVRVGRCSFSSSSSTSPSLSLPGVLPSG